MAVVVLVVVAAMVVMVVVVEVMEVMEAMEEEAVLPVAVTVAEKQKRRRPTNCSSNR
jgi:hypothetical protein